MSSKQSNIEQMCTSSSEKSQTHWLSQFQSIMQRFGKYSNQPNNTETSFSHKDKLKPDSDFNSIAKIFFFL